MKTPWKLVLLLSMAAGTLQVYKCRDGWTLSSPDMDKCWKAVAVQPRQRTASAVDKLWTAGGACRKEYSRLAVLSNTVHAFYARRFLDQHCRGTGTGGVCATLCFQNELDPLYSYHHRMPWHVEEFRNRVFNDKFPMNFERPLKADDVFHFVFALSAEKLYVKLQGGTRVTSDYVFCKANIATGSSHETIKGRDGGRHLAIKLPTQELGSVIVLLWTFNNTPNSADHNISVFVSSRREPVDSFYMRRLPTQIVVEADQKTPLHIFFSPQKFSQSATEFHCSWGQNAGGLKIPAFEVRNVTFALCEKNASVVETPIFTSRFFDSLSSRNLVLMATAPVAVAAVDVFFILFSKK